MNEQRQLADYLRPGLEAFAILLGFVALTYTLLTPASFLLGFVFASACWLAASLDRLRLSGTNTRRIEDSTIVGLSALVLLYGLFTTGLLSAIGVVALLWIGVNVARIERAVRADDAE